MIKQITVILFLLTLLNFSTVFAAFPITNVNQHTELSTTTTVLPPTPTSTKYPDTKHHHHHYHQEQTEKYDLSIVSSVLAVASLIALGFAVGTLAAPLAGVGIVLAVVAFIVGAQALNRKQKLKGLAILGLIIGGIITIKFIAAIIPVLLGTK